MSIIRSQISLSVSFRFDLMQSISIHTQKIKEMSIKDMIDSMIPAGNAKGKDMSLNMLVVKMGLFIKVAFR